MQYLHSHIWPSGIVLSNTCSEIYILQFCTPCLSLQHTSALQAHCGEHSDRGFISSQDTKLQYTYNIACTVTCWSVPLCSVQCSLQQLSLCSVQCSLCLQSLCSLLPLCCGNEVPDPRTASRQNDAAASHSCHFNTVLYPWSYSEYQLTLNRSRHYIPSADFSAKIIPKFRSHSIKPPTPLQTPEDGGNSSLRSIRNCTKSHEN